MRCDGVMSRSGRIKDAAGYITGMNIDDPPEKGNLWIQPLSCMPTKKRTIKGKRTIGDWVAYYVKRRLISIREAGIFEDSEGPQLIDAAPLKVR